MLNRLYVSIKTLLLMTLITGIIYPLTITLLSLLLFPEKSSGSLVTISSRSVGSELLGQNFSDDKYFQCRPSSIDFNPNPSGGSNLSLGSKKLKEIFEERKRNFCSKNLLSSEHNVPSEMLFASASGVDPHISPEAAYLQIERIARTRDMNTEQKKKVFNLVHSSVRNPQLGILGKPIVNVLLLNIELDKIDKQ